MKNFLDFFMLILKRFRKSVSHAFRGLQYTLRHEHNFQMECILSLAVITLGTFVHLTRSEWIFVIFACFWVMAFELMNTAVERVVNVLKPSPHPYARVIKDVMAAGVFLSAIGACAIGLIIFLPHWWH
jgi:diacylglycerol kinase